MNAEGIRQALLVLSRVSVNDKIVAWDGTLNIQPPGYLRTLSRVWYQETRYRNVTALQALFATAATLMELLCLKRDFVPLARLRTAYSQAIAGLRNLQETYRDDVDIYCKLSVLISDSESFLSLMPSEHERSPYSTAMRTDDSGAGADTSGRHSEAEAPEAADDP